MAEQQVEMSEVPNIPTARCVACRKLAYDEWSRLCLRCLADYGRTNETMWDFCGYGLSISDWLED